MPWEDPDTAYATQASSAIPVVPQEILAKKAKAAAKLYEEKVCSSLLAAWLCLSADKLSQAATRSYDRLAAPHLRSALGDVCTATLAGIMQKEPLM